MFCVAGEEFRVTAFTVPLSFETTWHLLGMIARDCVLDEDAAALRVSALESDVSSGQEPGVVIFNSGT